MARLSRGGAKAASLHLRYIERDGVNNDGSKGFLYDADGPLRAGAFDQPRRGEKHQFRIIVSPEDARELDLTAYVRRLMAQVERDTGRRLEWAAVNHYDTDHPHAHLIDRDGRELRLDRSYISNGLRSRAQELATEELGPRLDVDVRRALAREVAQSRFTSLDRELERRAQDGRVEARSRRHAGRIDESLLVARLEHLEALRLSERVAPAAWTLHPGWQEQLRELAARGDILRQIHMAVGGDRSRYRIVRSGRPLEDGPAKDGTVLLGRVASKGLSDELKGRFYAVLETASGRTYHVPLEARSAQDVSVGDIVSMKSVPDARVVTQINAEVAQEKGGADPGRCRLLVCKQPLSLQEQVGHGGPVWLDGVDRSALSHWGFGAEVRRALDRRREALQGMGIAPDDPRREAKLRERERRTRGEEIAARSGQQFLANTPDRFRGRLQQDSRRPTYAVVSDGIRFVLLPASAATHGLAGKRVSLSRDAAGRIKVHALEADRGK